MKELMTAAEVKELCGVKDGKAYKIIRDLNRELEGKGFIVVRGKVNRSYLMKRLGIGAFKDVSN